MKCSFCSFGWSCVLRQTGTGFLQSPHVSGAGLYRGLPIQQPHVWIQEIIHRGWRAYLLYDSSDGCRIQTQERRPKERQSSYIISVNYFWNSKPTFIPLIRTIRVLYLMYIYVEKQLMLTYKIIHALICKNCKDRWLVFSKLTTCFNAKIYFVV